MHTLKVIAAGLLILGVFLVVARRFGSPLTRLYRAASLFIGVWLVVSLGNLIVGVVHAGYSVGAEAPIFLVVFGVPALAALFVRWRYPIK